MISRLSREFTLYGIIIVFICVCVFFRVLKKDMKDLKSTAESRHIDSTLEVNGLCHFATDDGEEHL